jgi:hypothetical protein
VAFVCMSNTAALTSAGRRIQKCAYLEKREVVVQLGPGGPFVEMGGCRVQQSAHKADPEPIVRRVDRRNASWVRPTIRCGPVRQHCSSDHAHDVQR